MGVTINGLERVALPLLVIAAITPKAFGSAGKVLAIAPPSKSGKPVNLKITTVIWL